MSKRYQRPLPENRGPVFRNSRGRPIEVGSWQWRELGKRLVDQLAKEHELSEASSVEAQP